jgi:hypothetical protein
MLDGSHEDLLQATCRHYLLNIQGIDLVELFVLFELIEEQVKVEDALDDQRVLPWVEWGIKLLALVSLLYNVL